MKKIQGYIIALLGMLVLLAGCGSSDPVKEDLTHYLNTELAGLAPIQKEVMGEFTSLMNTSKGNPQEMSATLSAKILPKYEEFVKSLEQMKPETDEVKKLHDKYLSAAHAQLEAFNSIIKAINSKDQKKLAEAAEQLDDADKMEQKFQESLKKLSEAHGLK